MTAGTKCWSEPSSILRVGTSDMSEKRTRPIVILVFAVLVVLLCAGMVAGGYWLGRRVADDGQRAVGEATTAEVEQGARPAAVAPEDSETPVKASPAPAQADAQEEDAASGSGEAEGGDVTSSEGTATPESAAENVTTEEAQATEEPEEFVRREVDFTAEDLELFWEVWEIVQEDFDGQLPPEDELTYAVIRGLLESLDDEYTRFTPPEAAELVRERMEGTFEGIGAFVEENEEGLTEIVRPMDGQPADLAGLQAGDVVIGVDGESVLDRTLEEVIALIRGPEGTDVTLTIRREGVEPFDVTITRAFIEIPIVESEMLEEGVAYLRLTSFSANAEEQLAVALEELLAQNPEGLILDLRDNPGGFLDQSIAVADLFLPEGVVLYERSRTRDDIDEVYRAETGDLAEEIPMAVLINAGSASASEIVAGAIRDYERGVLIGETTFGKGSVQLTHTLSDGSELRVTIARFYLPSNESISGNGIEPDIAVATPEDLGGENDDQIQEAIEFLTNGE